MNSVNVESQSFKVGLNSPHVTVRRDSNQKGLLTELIVIPG